MSEKERHKIVEHLNKQLSALESLSVTTNDLTLYYEICSQIKLYNAMLDLLVKVKSHGKSFTQLSLDI